MDPETVALASTFGGAIVASMATDAWQEVRNSAVEIWRRFQPGRADSTERLLEANRTHLMGMQADAMCQFQRFLVAQWHHEAVALIQSNSAASAALAELNRAMQSNEVNVHQSGRSHGNSRIFMAGRDQNFGASE